MFFRQLLSPTLQPRSFVMAMFVMLISSVAIVAQDGRTELPVRGGLTVWLDASTIAEKPSDGVSEGTNVIEWKDSAARRIFEQRDSKLQPKLKSVAGTSFVRFDGVDDHLRVISNGISLQASTIFIAAAPHANPGEFRGLFAANAPDRRDYESGLTIDLGPGPGFRFETLNVEGRGFGGAADLLNSGHDFGTLHILETVIDSTAGRISLKLDGKDEGNRPFQVSAVSFDELTVGARFYTNGRELSRFEVRFEATSRRSSSTTECSRAKKPA